MQERVALREATKSKAAAVVVDTAEASDVDVCESLPNDETSVGPSPDLTGVARRRPPVQPVPPS